MTGQGVHLLSCGVVGDGFSSFDDSLLDADGGDLSVVARNKLITWFFDSLENSLRRFCNVPFSTSASGVFIKDLYRGCSQPPL